MKHYIYILIDPITKLVRYVGKTTNLSRRRSQQLYEARNSIKRNHRNNWINGLLNKGLEPERVVIDEMEDDWQFWEKHYISLFKSWGFKLVNETDGGEGQKNATVSYKTRIKISNSNKGKIVKQEVRDRIRNSLKGRVRSEEFKAKASIAAKKRGISSETRLKMLESKKQKGTYNRTEEERRKISEGMKAYRQKLRNAQIKRDISNDSLG